MLLTTTEFDRISIDNVVFTLKPSIFVKRPHFTTKKPTPKHDFSDLEDYTKSPKFLDFCDEVLNAADFDKTKVKSSVQELNFQRQRVGVDLKPIDK